MTANASDRFLALDGLRGVAAIFVLSAHVHGEALFRHFSASYLAVDFFFALSGFVLAHAYNARLEAGMTIAAFMRARLIRLYPLYLLGLGLGALAYLGQAAWTHELDVVRFVVSTVLGLVFLPTPPDLSVLSTHAFPLNIPAWSLCFEIFINLIFAALAAHLTWRRLIALAALSAVALIATAVHFGSLQVGFAPGNFVGGFARVAFSFFAGVLIHRVWRGGGFQGLTAPVLVPAALLIFAFAIPASQRALRDLLLVMLMLPSIIVLGSVSAPKGFMARLCALLGAGSYAFYALHAPLISIAESLTLDLAGREFQPGSVETVALAGIVFVIALAADSWFDGPVRRRLSRLLPTAVGAGRGGGLS